MDDREGVAQQHERVVEGFQAYAAGQSELGREFARHTRMHVTDSVAVVEILRAEDHGQPLTPARLAERVGLSSGATSILLNRLEDAGHIVRRRGHADRRLVTLHSLPAVHDAAEEFFSPLRARFEELMSHYTPDQLDLVEEFVSGVRTAIDGYTQEIRLP